MHKPAAVLTYVTAHHLPHFHTRFYNLPELWISLSPIQTHGYPNHLRSRPVRFIRYNHRRNLFPMHIVLQCPGLLLIIHLVKC